MAVHAQTTPLHGYEAAEAVGPGITVPDAALLFAGDFARAGQDLVLTGSDGAKFVVTGYFNTDTPPALLSPQGAMLTGDVVTSLAGPQFPGQYAQAGADAAQGAKAIGSVQTLDGSATVVRASGVTETLKVGDPVFQGDVVMTGPGGKLGISFVDGTIFSLSANARMVLNSLVYDPDGSDNSMLFSLVEGTFVFASGKIAPTGDMKIQTPVATMGIRGTAPTVNIDSNLGTVNFSIVPDPGDGHVGSYTLYSLETGDAIGTVSSVGSKWVITSATGEVIELEKSEADLLNDAEAISQINAVYTRWATTQQESEGPQAGPDGNPSSSSGLNTNPPNNDTNNNENTGGGNTPPGNTEGDPPPGSSSTPPGNNNTNNDFPTENNPDPNQPPAITGDRALTVDEGGTATVTPADLTGTDPDDSGTGLVYTVTRAPSHGQLELTTNPGVAITSFTQADLDAGRVVYVHNGSETIVDSYDVSLADGGEDGALPATATVDVTINPVTDIINGSEFADVLNGTTGDDIINGFGGNDFINAGPGNDIVNAGAGNDFIVGGNGEGDDTYNGDGGTDTLSYTSTTQGVTIDLTSGLVTGPQTGTDTINSIERFIGGSGNDTIIISQDSGFFFDGGAGTDTIRIVGGLNIDTDTAQSDAVNYEIVDLNQTHDNTFAISADDVHDANENHTIQFLGGQGDTLVLRNDFFDDQGQLVDGFWQLTGQQGGFDIWQFIDDQQQALATAEVQQGIQVESNAAPVAQDEIPDQQATMLAPFVFTVVAASFFDPDGDALALEARLENGDPLPDWLTFNPQTQTFEGTPGREDVGELSIVVTAKDPDGESASQTFELDVALQGTIGKPGFDFFFGNGGDNIFVGLGGNDIIFGNGGNDHLFGDGGIDIISGGSGEDTIHGGDDSDLLSGDGGNDTIFGGDGNDVISGGRGNDTLHGDGGNDLITGDRGNDTLSGGDGIDLLFGGRGDDELTGGAGFDILDGGPGDDTFIFTSIDGSVDLITDFDEDDDTLDLTGLLGAVFDPNGEQNIEDFVRAETDAAGNTTISVDVDGPGPAEFTDIAVLQGIGADIEITINIGDDDHTVTSSPAVVV